MPTSQGLPDHPLPATPPLEREALTGGRGSDQEAGIGLGALCSLPRVFISKAELQGSPEFFTPLAQGTVSARSIAALAVVPAFSPRTNHSALYLSSPHSPLYWPHLTPQAGLPKPASQAIPRH